MIPNEVTLEYIAIVLAVVVVSMVLHELAHAWTAYLLGDETAKDEGRLSLNPIKHLDPFMSVLLPLMLALMGGPIFGGAKPVPINTRNIKWREWGFALVAIAGPLTNLILAFLGFVALYIMGALYVGGTQNIWSEILWVVLSVNLGFCVFNMIPIPPLDGSRILYALAPDFVRRVMEQMERYGMILVLAMVLILGSMLSNIMMGAISGIWSLFVWIVGA
jgi:Zn-dependent protease